MFVFFFFVSVENIKNLSYVPGQYKTAAKNTSVDITSTITGKETLLHNRATINIPSSSLDAVSNRLFSVY
jgi:hypothetical protein